MCQNTLYLGYVPMTETFSEQATKFGGTTGGLKAETLSGQAPKFGGSTGGLLRKAEVEEKYAITWTSTKEQVFEMPTAGAAIMNEGENILYLATKEQCLALGIQLRKFKPKIEDYKIYRIYPTGEVQFLFPLDGVFSEKVNPGREFNGKIDRRIGENPEPATLKFSGKKTYEV